MINFVTEVMREKWRMIQVIEALSFKVENEQVWLELINEEIFLTES